MLGRVDTPGHGWSRLGGRCPQIEFLNRAGLVEPINVTEMLCLIDCRYTNASLFPAREGRLPKEFHEDALDIGGSRLGVPKHEHQKVID